MSTNQNRYKSRWNRPSQVAKTFLVPKLKETDNEPADGDCFKAMEELCLNLEINPNLKPVCEKWVNMKNKGHTHGQCMTLYGEFCPPDAWGSLYCMLNPKTKVFERPPTKPGSSALDVIVNALSWFASGE